METTERSNFVRSYTRLLTNAWSDDAVLSRLRSDPKATLADYGLDVPAGSSVDIVTSTQGDGDLDEQVRLWEEGRSSGHIKLYVPEVPQLETAELSDDQLETVAGGGDTYCCCCCPCCTCT